MGRYVKSISDTKKLNTSIQELQKQFELHKNVVRKNTKELEKANLVVAAEKEKEIIALEKKLNSLQSDIQWVKNEEPAVKLNSEDMLKKLDIL